MFLRFLKSIANLKQTLQAANRVVAWGRTTWRRLVAHKNDIAWTSLTVLVIVSIVVVTVRPDLVDRAASRLEHLTAPVRLSRLADQAELEELRTTTPNGKNATAPLYI